jgi:hypothetical protein
LFLLFYPAKPANNFIIAPEIVAFTEKCKRSLRIFTLFGNCMYALAKYPKSYSLKQKELRQVYQVLMSSKKCSKSVIDW